MLQLSEGDELFGASEETANSVEVTPGNPFQAFSDTGSAHITPDPAAAETAEANPAPDLGGGDMFGHSDVTGPAPSTEDMFGLTTKPELTGPSNEDFLTSAPPKPKNEEIFAPTNATADPGTADIFGTNVSTAVTAELGNVEPKAETSADPLQSLGREMLAGMSART